MKLFEFAVIYVPSEAQDSTQASTAKKPTILVKPDVVLAKDAESVKLKAARMIPVEFEDELHNVQIVVRPF